MTYVCSKNFFFLCSLTSSDHRKASTPRMRRTKSDIVSTRRSRSANACAKRRSSSTSSTSLKSASSSCARSSPPRSSTSQTRSSRVHRVRRRTRLAPSTSRGRTATQCPRSCTTTPSGANARSWKSRAASRRVTALCSTLRRHALQNNQRLHRPRQHRHQPQSLPQSSPRHLFLHQTTFPPRPAPSSLAHSTSSRHPNQTKSSSSTAMARSKRRTLSKSSRHSNRLLPRAPTRTTRSGCVSGSLHARPRQPYHPRNQHLCQHQRLWPPRRGLRHPRARVRNRYSRTQPRQARTRASRSRDACRCRT